jgi:23S rRNA (uracil747-C5)-methyltransferase
MRCGALRLVDYAHLVDCAYFAAGRCGSCTELPTPYDVQLDAKERRCREALADHPDISGVSWLSTAASATEGFRNKAKMVVAGTPQAPTLGILDPSGTGVDLRLCPLYSPAMHGLLEVLSEFVVRARLTPYDVSLRRGELKHLIVTESPDGEFLVRFVLRSTEGVPRIRKHLPALLAEHPSVAVVSVNRQPEHKAILEGPEEEILTDRLTLPMRVNDRVLHLRPRSFFQTNTDLAATLYRQASSWADEVGASSVLDLYCGVGGFALHLAAPGRRVRGVELSEEAVASAVATATESGLAVDFVCGDATAVDADAELVVVNPPRRGLGPDLCARLESSSARWVVYSSCNVTSLARDLAQLPSWVPRRARVIDMFAHTSHFEVITLLERR